MALNILRDFYATEGKAHDAAEGAGAGSSVCLMLANQILEVLGRGQHE